MAYFERLNIETFFLQSSLPSEPIGRPSIWPDKDRDRSHVLSHWAVYCRAGWAVDIFGERCVHQQRQDLRTCKFEVNNNIMVSADELRGYSDIAQSNTLSG